jgi:hypothetical protein
MLIDELCDELEKLRTLLQTAQASPDSDQQGTSWRSHRKPTSSSFCGSEQRISLRDQHPACLATAGYHQFFDAAEVPTRSVTRAVNYKSKS